MALVMNIPREERESVKSEKQPISHFSHRHPLMEAEIHEDDCGGGVCSGCEHDVVGPAYVCTKSTCDFLLHDLCADLPHRIRHRCHAAHPLLLLPGGGGGGEFTCDACGRAGRGFTYHCSTCRIDLHVECAALPEVERRGDHHHPLILISDFGGKKKEKEEKMDGQDFACYACGDPAAEGRWMYCCLACKCGLHLGCAENSS